MMTTINQSTVRVNDVTLAYLEAGSGPLALLLHGFPDTAWGWEPTLAALADAGFHAVAPFMRGYAPSEVPADGRYQTGVLALDAIALHEQLGGDEPGVIVGHDWGAMATYGATNHEPDRWRKAVVAGVPPASLMTAALLDYDNLKERFWYQFFFCNPLSDLAVPMDDLAFIDRLWGDWSPGFEGSRHIERVKESLRGSANIAAALLYYRQTLGGVDNDPELADIQATSFQAPPQPTLYIHGLDDGCIACPGADELAAAFAAPGSKAVRMPDVGHFLQYEAPGEFSQLVVDFLSA